MTGISGSDVKKSAIWAGLLLLALMLAGLELATGSVPLAWNLVWQDPGSLDRAILLDFRLPRLLAAAGCGAALGLAGALMQTYFRNPLVEPGLLGVSAGGALVVVAALALTTVLGLPLPAGLAPIGGLVGALLALWLTRLVARGNRLDPVAGLLLAGLAINALCSAGLAMLLTILPDNGLRSAVGWMLGSFAGADVRLALLLLAATAVVIAWGGSRHRALDLWLLGRDVAWQSGLHAGRLEWGLLVTSAVLVGLSAAVAGPVAFVGLMAAHVTRLLLGASHAQLLPGSVTVGLILTLAGDVLARQLWQPLDLPVGAVMALIGAPFFLWLLHRRQEPL